MPELNLHNIFMYIIFLKSCQEWINAVTLCNLLSYFILHKIIFRKEIFMEALQFFQLFLALLVPGLIGALAYSIAARFTTEIQITMALILDLSTFVIMITGLYFFKDIFTIAELIFEFGCLSFTRNYILLSILINIILGVIYGLIRRLYFWIRRRSFLIDRPGV